MRSSATAIAFSCIFLLMGCDEPDAEELIEKEFTIAEQQQEGTVFVNIDDDGEAQLVVKNSKQAVVSQEVEGKLIVAGGEGEDELKVDLTVESERGVLTAKLPELDAPVTTISYAATGSIAAWRPATTKERGEGLLVTTTRGRSTSTTIPASVATRRGPREKATARERSRPRALTTT